MARHTSIVNQPQQKLKTRDNNRSPQAPSPWHFHSSQPYGVGISTLHPKNSRNSQQPCNLVPTSLPMTPTRPKQLQQIGWITCTNPSTPPPPDSHKCRKHMTTSNKATTTIMNRIHLATQQLLHILVLYVSCLTITKELVFCNCPTMYLDKCITLKTQPSPIHPTHPTLPPSHHLYTPKAQGFSIVTLLMGHGLHKRWFQWSVYYNFEWCSGWYSRGEVAVMIKM